jgi:polar amino acid transport system substrate-binding protein
MTGASAQAVSPEVLKDLAPTGKLRAAINFGNGVLAQRGANGEANGITPDLSRELAKRLGVPVDFVTYDAAGKVFDDASVIEFSPPYVIIEGTYMVRKTSPLKTVEDVDKPGIRIAVGLKSAYDLYLTRTIKHATLVRAETGGGRAMIDMFRRDNLEVAAGVRQPLEDYARGHPDMRVMDGAFQEINQAMGVPKGKFAGAKYVAAFVEDMKASGFVADALKRSNQKAKVAAPAK